MIYPAFPDQLIEPKSRSGMTLRDHFAGLVISAIVGSSHRQFAGAETELQCDWAYQIADAMLKARGEQ